MIYLDSKTLKSIMIQKLESDNLSQEATYHLANSLIQTSLRGVDSHGINLFPHYYRVIKTGRINKNPEIILDKRGDSVAVLDADHTFGHHAGALAMKLAIKLSKETGIGAVSVKNSSHFGAAAYFGLMAPEENCIGLAFTNADTLVKVYGSSEAYGGTNPICFTAPLENEEPLCLDMATSLVAFNKIKNYQRSGKAIPANWGFDDKGFATEDPYMVKSLSPIGEYKGYGLGLMIEVLCGILTGGPFGKHILSMYKTIESKRYLSHFFCAIDISRFIDINLFKINLQKMVDEIRKLPVMENHETVMVPGDPEKNKFKVRIESGIPVDEVIMGEFLEISGTFEKAIMI